MAHSGTFAYEDDLVLVRMLWDYPRFGEEVCPADLIFVLGSHDVRVADRAAELVRRGYTGHLPG